MTGRDALPADLAAALRGAAVTPVLLVASDFDGTLAPIVNHPPDARPLPDAAAALAELADLPDTVTALISGRALADLADLAAMPSTVQLVGSHGAEFATGFSQPVDDDLVAQIVTTLRQIAARFPGTTVEPKRASVALHVRNATPDDGAAALAAARAASQDWRAEPTEGKAVLEFAVINTDKGAAIEAIREQSGATTVVFFGDDVTDEKAFRRLRGDDIGVKVGDGESAARFRVDEPTDVSAALGYLLQLRRARAGPTALSD